jgi:hypothetical protein
VLYRLSYVGTSFKPKPKLSLKNLSTHPKSAADHGYCNDPAVSSMERVMGIEPTPSAWKAEVLPLNYTRTLVEGVGFEPTKA